MFYVLSCTLTTLSRCYRYLSPSRSLSSTIAIRLAEQVYVTGQLLRHVCHLILQLQVLHLAHSFSESSPYCLKVHGWVVGPDHRKGMSDGGNNSIAVEALEVLPRRLAPFDDGVRMWWPAVGLRSHL